MVPLLGGPFPKELLSADEPIKVMLEKAKTKHPSYRPLRGNGESSLNLPRRKRSRKSFNLFYDMRTSLNG